MRAGRRIARVATGVALAIVGVVLLVLPGPGLPILIGAAVLLEPELPWLRPARERATAWLRPARERATAWTARVRADAGRAFGWVRSRTAYGLAALPVLTDWIDTGHWPSHPREFVTEAVVGVVILAGVRGLHARAERFRWLSETDALTGLRNRARFRHDLDAAFEARETTGALSLAFVDLDRFKAINDGHGHGAGDAALRAVARTLDRSVRQGVDAAYRLGGDEFALLFSGADAPTAAASLARAAAAGRTDLDFELGLSVGVVTLRPGEALEAFVERADRRMYLTKRGASAPSPEEAGLRVRLHPGSARPGADPLPSRQAAPPERGASVGP